MTSQTSTGPEQHHLEGRSVRDIVEYSPEQVNEVWCRKIFRQILQSLELQYAMHMPHRTITPDTIVFHDNGEPLLIPTDVGTAEARAAEDMNALARVVHYAITSELAPAGPLAGRVEGYSDSLVNAVDRCMDPDPARRPHSIEALRDLLGIVPLGPPAGGATAHRAARPDLAGFPDLGPGFGPDFGTDLGTAPVPGVASGHPRAPSATPAAEAPPERPHDHAPMPAAAPTAAVPPDRTGDRMHDLTPEPARNRTPDHARSPARHLVPDRVPATVAATVPAAAAPPGITVSPSFMQDAERPRRGLILNRWQRWAVAAGGGAILLALALAMFAEMRDSGSFDHIVLTLPQRGDGPRAGMDGAGARQPGGTYAGDNGASPSTGASGGATAAGPGGMAPGGIDATATSAGPDNAPGGNEPGAQSAAQPAAGGRLPGVVVTPEGNLYKLRIQPWGIVYVDGVDRGVSPPVKHLALAPGRHTVRVTNPNFHERVLEVDTASGDGQISVDFDDESR